MKVGNITFGDDRICRIESNASSHILSRIAVDVATIEDEIGRNLLEVHLVGVTQRDDSIVGRVTSTSGIRRYIWVHRQFDADEPVGPGSSIRYWASGLK